MKILFRPDTCMQIDDDTDEKTGGGRDGGGRAEDVTIFVRSDNNGQDQELVHQRGEVWREKKRESRPGGLDIVTKYDHVRRKDGYVGRKMLRMELP